VNFVEGCADCEDSIRGFFLILKLAILVRVLDYLPSSRISERVLETLSAAKKIFS